MATPHATIRLITNRAVALPRAFFLHHPLLLHFRAFGGVHASASPDLDSPFSHAWFAWLWTFSRSLPIRTVERLRSKEILLNSLVTACAFCARSRKTSTLGSASSQALFHARSFWWFLYFLTGTVVNESFLWVSGYNWAALPLKRNEIVRWARLLLWFLSAQ